MGRALIAAAVVATAGAAAILPARTLAAVPEGRLPPRPVEIVSAPTVPQGEVRIDPAVAVVAAGPGEAAQPEFGVDSGVDGTVTVALSVVDVVPGEDGAPALRRGGADGPATWVTLPADEVFLGRGERALVRPAVDVPAGAEEADHVVALVAEARGAEGESATVRSYLVIEGGAALEPPEVRVDVGGGDRLVRLEIASPAGRAAVVSGRVDLRAWWGGTVTSPVPETVVLPGSSRVLEVGIGRAALPGPYGVTAALRTAGGDDLAATTSAWLWPSWGAVAILVAAVAAAALAGLVAARIRRR
ncbi:MAG: hypothetical protein ACRDUY_14965 [Nitriliruptorales bacterium]